MGKIVWLASYPKSGNTWMRVFLTNYRRNDHAPADINNLDNGPIASARIWFDEWTGIEASVLDDATIERLRPEVYRCMAREATDTLYMKVHDAWSRVGNGESLFPSDITAGVIYILRNPLDMAASCAHHWGVSQDKAVANMCDPEFTMAPSLGGLSDQLRQRMRSWSGHVGSWLDESQLPVHVVRYEDLMLDPFAKFGEIVRFCGLPYDEERLRKAIGFSDFSELRRQEKDKGFKECSVRAPGPFFRRGQTGAWRKELSPELIKRLIAVHGPMMKRFAYLNKNNEPI